jgi:ABC-2 type transport system ATP-binding protein
VHQLVSDEKIAVLWASHLIDEIYSDDHLIVLHQGQIKANGRVQNVLKLTETDNLSAAFETLTSKK